MSTLNLWLIRHGETTANQGTWSTDLVNLGLTQKGEEQAQAAAKQITTAPDLLIISPLKRAQDSALPIIERWPHTKIETWPIQEFMYLSPQIYQDKTRAELELAKEKYWRQSLPFYCESQEVESFAHFLKRVETFNERLCMRDGFIVAVGHGQFFKAFEFGLKQGFTSTAEWMQTFRQWETSHPLKNGEILKLSLPTIKHQHE